jgi:hypothetical protein
MSVASSKCADTNCIATGVFFTVKPAGKVMVGLPLMSNGAVNLIKRANSAGTVPMTDISWVVGDAMGCAGINSKSQFWKNPRTAPVKARRRQGPAGPPDGRS